MAFWDVRFAFEYATNAERESAVVWLQSRMQSEAVIDYEGRRVFARGLTLRARLDGDEAKARRIRDAVRQNIPPQRGRVTLHRCTHDESPPHADCKTLSFEMNAWP